MPTCADRRSAKGQPPHGYDHNGGRPDDVGSSAAVLYHEMHGDTGTKEKKEASGWSSSSTRLLLSEIMGGTCPDGKVSIV